MKHALVLACIQRISLARRLHSAPSLLSNSVAGRRNARFYSTEASLVPPSPKVDAEPQQPKSRLVGDGPSFEYFVANAGQSQGVSLPDEFDFDSEVDLSVDETPYLLPDSYASEDRKVYFETYGCQMNVNDMEIVWSILKKNGFTKTDEIKTSDVILIMTCSVREGAETKIWNRLVYLNSLKKKRKREKTGPPLKIVILGCMAERLKTRLLETENLVDVVCGPDAYRDLPRLLALTTSGLTAVNVQLSLEETYADVMPVRLGANSVSAFVSVMRGCDNMCAYCIVPFTRGRERSRPLQTIVDEVATLADDGVREVTLLGQNVNSYRDATAAPVAPPGEHEAHRLSSGFRTVYRSRSGGRRFAELLDRVAAAAPGMRLRFTSPHPKDFPDEVLDVIRRRPNICCQLHLPAQSGSSRVLESMRRGYTREAYLDLVDRVRSVIPGVSLSSDFIAGFCGEREEDHEETLSLIQRVGYNFSFSFPYSMRQKTRASHRLVDDVPDDVKARRHRELAHALRQGALRLNSEQVGRTELVLVEGPSKRSISDWAGRNESNIRVILPAGGSLPVDGDLSSRAVAPGDFVAVKITAAGSQVLHGTPLYLTTLQQFYAEREAGLNRLEQL